MFVRENNELVTPRLTGSILPGITRKSIIELAPTLGLVVKEETLDVEKTITQIQDASITEAFAIGTGALIAPVGKFGYREKKIIVNNNKTGPIARKLYQSLNMIQRGGNKVFEKWLTEV